MSTETQPGTQTITAPAPAPAAPPTSPMLSYMSAPAPIPTATQPTPAPAPTVVAPVVTTVVNGSAAESLGTLASDPQVKVAVSYLDAVAQESGLNIQRALGQSVSEGSTKFIDVAYIREAVKDPVKASNIIQTLTSIVEYSQVAQERLITGVHQKAGGEANWLSAVAAFNKTADAATKATLVNLLESSNQQSVDYAVDQILQKAKEAGVVIVHNAPTLGFGGSDKGYTRAEFAAIIQKPNLTDAEHAEARRLRTLGKQQGI